MSEPRNYIAADGTTMTRLEWWQLHSAEQDVRIAALEKRVQGLVTAGDELKKRLLDACDTVDGEHNQHSEYWDEAIDAWDTALRAG